MAWKKVSIEQSERLAAALEGYDQRKKQMFGCPAYFVGDVWFAGVHQDDILVRLGQEDRAMIMAEYEGARQFEPFEGRVMREFVVLPGAVTRDGAEFDRWLKKAWAYSKSLAPKTGRKKKKSPGQARQSS